MVERPLKILLEMRPALGGYAGIPQETRLLFRGLSVIDSLSVEGLIQSSTHSLGKGLPVHRNRWKRPLSPDQELNRLARIIVMLEQRFWRSYFSPAPMVIRHLLGWSEELTRFDPTHFRDYIWRRIFARTLPSEDFDTVTRAGFRIVRVPWTMMHGTALVTRKLGYALYPKLDTSDFDVTIVETPYPGSVSKSTHLVVRYHDAIPILMPHTISDRRNHQAFHYRALRKNVQDGAWFVCVSHATRRDLLSLFPEAEPRSLTIHNMISHDYFDESSSLKRVPEIIKARFNDRKRARLDPSIKRRLFDEGTLPEALDYLLIVSTIEPRKNHVTLLSAWEKLRANEFPRLKLVIVGALGWHHKAIIRRFRPWMERGDAFLLADVPSSELRILYKHASVTVCPSLGEGFDFSGVESMLSGGAVVASDIPVHREVYSDAAEYFNPYSIDDLSRAIKGVIDPGSRSHREGLVARGAVVARRYAPSVILPKWQSFLASLQRREAER